MNLQEFHGENWVEEVLMNDLPVLVDFRGPGEIFNASEDALLKEIQEDWRLPVRIGTLDAELYPEVARTYHIPDFPTLVLFFGGEIQYTSWGLDRVRRMISFWFKTSETTPVKIWN